MLRICLERNNVPVQVIYRHLYTAQNRLKAHLDSTGIRVLNIYLFKTRHLFKYDSIDLAIKERERITNNLLIAH